MVKVYCRMSQCQFSSPGFVSTSFTGVSHGSWIRNREYRTLILIAHCKSNPYVYDIKVLHFLYSFEIPNKVKRFYDLFSL